MHLLKCSWMTIKTTKTTTFVSIRQWKENVQFIKLSFMKLYVYRWFITFSHFLLLFRMWMWVCSIVSVNHMDDSECVVEIRDFYLNGATPHSPRKMDAQKYRLAHKKGIKSIIGMSSMHEMCYGIPISIRNHTLSCRANCEMLLIWLLLVQERARSHRVDVHWANKIAFYCHFNLIL